MLDKSIDWIRVVHKELSIREIISQSQTALFGRYETKDLQDMPDKIYAEAYRDKEVKPEVPKTLYQQMKQFEAMGVKIRYEKKKNK